MRAVAQMISYEVPLLLSSIAVIMAAGSLSTVEIVEKQAGFRESFPTGMCSRRGASPDSSSL
jgi:NADH-quinone oxidoreductase subunit H